MHQIVNQLPARRRPTQAAKNHPALFERDSIHTQFFFILADNPSGKGPIFWSLTHCNKRGQWDRNEGPSLAPQSNGPVLRD